MIKFEDSNNKIIGTFCEKCRNVVCICENTNNVKLGSYSDGFIECLSYFEKKLKRVEVYPGYYHYSLSESDFNDIQFVKKHLP